MLILCDIFKCITDKKKIDESYYYVIEMPRVLMHSHLFVLKFEAEGAKNTLIIANSLCFQTQHIFLIQYRVL